jgi:hypothetical protein
MGAHPRGELTEVDIADAHRIAEISDEALDRYERRRRGE